MIQKIKPSDIDLEELELSQDTDGAFLARRVHVQEFIASRLNELEKDILERERHIKLVFPEDEHFARLGELAISLRFIKSIFTKKK